MREWKDYNRVMMSRLFCAVVAVSLFAASTRAIDFKKETAPGKWIEELVPEDLPKLEYPSYFNDLDKARAQVQGGRYRMALVTLAAAKEAEPIEAAILKATALATLGRTSQAIETLSQPK